PACPGAGRPPGQAVAAGRAAGRGRRLMSAQGEPLEIICDAPPYVIVSACSYIGVEAPEDVRWEGAVHFLAEHGCLLSEPGAVLDAFPGKAGHAACCCGGPLPPLLEYRFFLSDGTRADYLLGQCGRCLTVYWHKAV